MTKAELSTWVEAKINDYAKQIIGGNNKADDAAFGELTFYMALRRVLSSEERRIQDHGMMDAISDTLQQLGVGERGKFPTAYLK